MILATEQKLDDILSDRITSATQSVILVKDLAHHIVAETFGQRLEFTRNLLRDGGEEYGTESESAEQEKYGSTTFARLLDDLSPLRQVAHRDVNLRFERVEVHKQCSRLIQPQDRLVFQSWRWHA